MFQSHLITLYQIACSKVEVVIISRKAPLQSCPLSKSGQQFACNRSRHYTYDLEAYRYVFGLVGTWLSQLPSDSF